MTTRDACGHERSTLFEHVEAALEKAARTGTWTHQDVERLCSDVRTVLGRELYALQAETLEREGGGSARYTAGLADGYALATQALDNFRFDRPVRT